jgi:acetyl-CoA synthase
MSASIEAKARHGAQRLVDTAHRMLQQALAERRPGGSLSFQNTVYYLPITLAAMAKPVERISELQAVLQKAGQELEPDADKGLAALLAAEVIEALRTPDGRFSAPISDAEVRSWGVQLADGRMPGVALILGHARNDVAAAKLIEGLRRHNILCLLGASVEAGDLSHQLIQEQIESGSARYIVPLGKEPTSAVHGLGLMVRCAMKLGGHKPGTWPEILHYCKRRTPGFVLTLSELDEPEYALACAARDLDFPLVLAVETPDVTEAAGPAKQVYWAPFESLDGGDDAAKAASLVEKCLGIRGIKPRVYSVKLPIPYGPAFEDETVSDADLGIEFGGESCRAFELLQMAQPDQISDGKIEVVGPGLPDGSQAAHMDLGIVVRMAGARLRTDFEPYLERQIHDFIGYVGGVQHAGQQDSISIRISRAAAKKGFGLESLGQVIQARFREEFGTAIEKLEVMVITDPQCHREWLGEARTVYDQRRKRQAGLTDDQVDVFYVCTRCRAFAPNNVSIISPERVSPCGRCNWLDARAAYELNPAGVRRPIKIGKPIDLKKGIWEGTNQYASSATRGRMNEVALYSIMQNPMSACGDFECIVMLIPEANGVMVVSHEDTTLPTPAGITIATFASIAAGEQIPGVVGVGRGHLLSPKFIAAEGGFRRVVWMSSRLKRSMSQELQAVCEREGDPALMDKIADEHNATTVAALVRWLEGHNHPALRMERMF